MARLAALKVGEGLDPISGAIVKLPNYNGGVKDSDFDITDVDANGNGFHHE